MRAASRGSRIRSSSRVWSCTCFVHDLIPPLVCEVNEARSCLTEGNWTLVRSGGRIIAVCVVIVALIVIEVSVIIIIVVVVCFHLLSWSVVQVWIARSIALACRAADVDGRAARRAS